MKAHSLHRRNSHIGIQSSSSLHRRAFTLIEVMVVVIVLSILAAIVAPKLFGNVDKAKWNTSKFKAATLTSALQSFEMDCRQLKSSDTMRELLWDGPSDVADGSWSGPYIKNEDALEDAWGNEFILEVPGTKNVDYDVVSYGGDSEPGGEKWDADIRQ